MTRPKPLIISYFVNLLIFKDLANKKSKSSVLINFEILNSNFVELKLIFTRYALLLDLRDDIMFNN